MTPALSVVVVAYDMARELPRTLATLGPAAQRVEGLEIIVVDNGSPVPVDAGMAARAGARLVRLDPAPPSPARAANRGIAESEAEVVLVLIDGARMLSPGVARGVLDAQLLHPRPIVTTLAFHIGSMPQMNAAAQGYDQASEDELLASVDWQHDGYELFSISCFAGSSARGWFGPMGECNAIAMPRTLWDTLGGFDEVFDRPGGGLVNHDLYRRACSLPDTELVMLLGEGSFHQYHGGAVTSGGVSRDELWAEYERLRGEPYEPPTRRPRMLGSVTASAMPHLAASVAWWERNALR